MDSTVTDPNPTPQPADEPVSVPPPARPLTTGGIITNPPIVLVGEEGCALTMPVHADEPAPVPPPVDALLKLVDEYGEERCLIAEARGNAGDMRMHIDQAADYLGEIQRKLNALYFAGVAEGRRQATEERTEEGLTLVTPSTAGCRRG